VNRDLGVGLEVGIHTAVTAFVHRPRPDGSDATARFRPDTRALAAASGGWNYAISISLSSLVAMGRVGANVHHISDVAAGFAIGTGSRLLAQKVCR
jgi:membrane-associated phospholipid phosphatase